MKNRILLFASLLCLFPFAGTACTSPVDNQSEFGIFYLQSGEKWAVGKEDSKEELPSSYFGAAIEVSDQAFFVWKRYDENDCLRFEWSDKRGCYVFQWADNSEALASVIKHDEMGFDITFRTATDPFFWASIGEAAQFDCHFAREIPFHGTFGEYPVEDVLVLEAYYGLPERDSSGNDLRWEDWSSLVQIRYDEFFLRCDFKNESSEYVLKKNYIYNPRAGAYQAANSALFTGNKHYQVRLSEDGFAVAARVNEGDPFEEYIKVKAHYEQGFSDPTYYTRLGSTNPRDSSSCACEKLSDPSELGSYHILSLRSETTTLRPIPGADKETDGKWQYPKNDSSVQESSRVTQLYDDIDALIHICDGRIYCYELYPKLLEYEWIFYLNEKGCYMPTCRQLDVSFAKLKRNDDGSLTLFVRYVAKYDSVGDLLVSPFYLWIEEEFALSRHSS